MRLLPILILIAFCTSCNKETSTKKELKVRKFEFTEFQDLKPIKAIFLNENLVMLGNETNSPNFGVYQFDIKGDFQNTIWKNQSDGSLGVDIIQDGNDLVICAEVETDEGQKQLEMFKISSEGIQLINKRFYSNSSEHLYKIIEKSNTEWLLVGYRADENTGVLGILLYVLDKENLTVKYEKYFPGIVLSVGADVKAKIGGDGFYLFGHSIEEEGGETDLFLYELSDSLDIVRVQDSFGGIEYEEASEILVDEEGFIYLLGHSASQDINHNVFVAKLDTSFGIIFEKQFGYDKHDGGESFALSDDHTFSIVARSNSTNHGDKSILYLEMDKQGNILENEFLGSDFDNRSDCIVHRSGVDYIFGYEWGEDGLAKPELYLIKKGD